MYQQSKARQNGHPNDNNYNKVLDLNYIAICDSMISPYLCIAVKGHVYVEIIFVECRPVGGQRGPYGAL